MDWQLTKDEWDTFVETSEGKYRTIHDLLTTIIDNLNSLADVADRIESTVDSIEANMPEEPEDE